MRRYSSLFGVSAISSCRLALPNHGLYQDSGAGAGSSHLASSRPWRAEHHKTALREFLASGVCLFARLHAGQGGPWARALALDAFVPSCTPLAFRELRRRLRPMRAPTFGFSSSASPFAASLGARLRKPRLSRCSPGLRRKFFALGAGLDVLASCFSSAEVSRFPARPLAPF